MVVQDLAASVFAWQLYVLQLSHESLLVLDDESTQTPLPVDGLLQVLGDDYLQSVRPSSSHLVKFLLRDPVFALQRLQPEARTLHQESEEDAGEQRLFTVAGTKFHLSLRASSCSFLRNKLLASAAAPMLVTDVPVSLRRL